MFCQVYVVYLEKLVSLLFKYNVWLTTMLPRGDMMKIN